jgi:hypothetical protein
MTSKQTALANASLLLVGASRIQSLDEDSTESILVKDFYERSYRALLSQYPWKFASKQRTLALTTQKPEFDFNFVFQLPSDYIWIQKAHPNQDYKILGDKFYSKYNSAGITYTWRVDEELMPIHFEQAFVYYLASQICISLTEDVQKQQLLYSQYQLEAKKARSLDAQMQPQDGFEDFPIDTVRY